MDQARDISSEEWREYEFGPDDNRTLYRIDSPARLYTGSTTHRVVDSDDVTHCLPRPGFDGCVLRWHGEPAVSF